MRSRWARTVDCSRICGLWWAPNGSRAMMENARGKPIAVQRPRGPCVLSARSRAGQTGDAIVSIVLGAVRRGGFESVHFTSSRCMRQFLGAEVLVLSPDRPDDPSHLVGESSIKFTPQQSLDSMETLLRCAVAQPFSRPSVELLGDGVTSTLSEAGHARSLGKILPEQTV